MVAETRSRFLAAKAIRSHLSDLVMAVETRSRFSASRSRDSCCSEVAILHRELQPPRA
ncbi:hypothetical protein TIFTF001_031238 [Ficus carica]|uniref:Uncharacterized protein n=1 Tax=Ficus carica TaxID=3494 RepID=A0AA88DWJ8_FICCA|nr:hypothetical protein TIFTF001_031238 [Ficus carica]